VDVQTRGVTERRFGLLALLIVLAGCGGGSSSSSTRASVTAGLTPTATATASPAPAPSATPTPTAPLTAAPTAAPAAPCAVASQSPPQGTIAANYPTALAFAPDGRLFWTERYGTVRVWQGGAARAFASVRTVTTEPGGGYSERGLLGLAISPTFAQDRFVYAFYSDADYTHQHVIRWRDCAGTGTGATVLVTLPSGSDCCHKGGRLAFGADGKLYVTLGEEHSAPAAQNPGDVRGKVLRYNPNGSIPADNPFGPANPVWAYGLRNPFGIAVARSGQIAVTSNGPSGDAGSPGTGYDTLILALARGGRYQWPNCYGYSHPIGGASCAGQIAPDWSSESGSAAIPTGAVFVDGAGPAGYAGHLVFCNFARGMLVVTPGSPHATVSGGPSGCRLDVKEGLDHALYYSDTGHIYRLA
jgi:glucose/arabinose dehydrogenase